MRTSCPASEMQSITIIQYKNSLSSPLNMVDHLESLRQSIRQLKPEGPEGFEGLVAAVLTDLAGRSFAIASSGSQHGRDGQSALDGGAILFEAKRYDDPIPKDKIYTKLFEVSADKSSLAELYVIAATCVIPTQHINTLTEGARKLGLLLLVVAWPETGLPELATLLAMASEVSAKFIARHASVSEADLISHLSAVQANSQFQARSSEVSAILRQISIAPAFALESNKRWLTTAFADSNRAKSVFGQALSPEDKSVACKLDRVNLRTELANKVFATPDGTVTAILGADGNGKSWIFAQAWSHQPNPPLTVVIVPDDVTRLPSVESCQELLISKLLTQTGAAPTAEAEERWLKYFDRWRSSPGISIPRLVVFVDGINQRESVDWLRFMDAMSAVVSELGGNLVFSCRRPFYRENLERRLVAKVAPVDVREWTDDELDSLLKERGTSIANLDDKIVSSLRNPRIFGIAASLFKTEEVTAFGELSVSRLLFEHIRNGSAVEGNHVSPIKFVADICAHATSILQRVGQQQDDDELSEFDLSTPVAGSEFGHAISRQFVVTSAGRFFDVVPENTNKYVLKDEGLPLALGLALVRTAREAQRKKRSIDEALSRILDPIVALDRTSDVLLGAILSAVLEQDSEEITAPLVRAFVSLQNVDAARYLEFRNLFGRQPHAFLIALELATLSPDVTSNLSWLTSAADDLRGNEAFEAAIAVAIHRWLNKYSLAPERTVTVPNDPGHSEKRTKELAERAQELSLMIESCSPTEHALLDSMVEEKNSDYSRLSLLAFLALARRPRAPFAESLRNWCFAASLNGGYRNHHREFNQLLHFNLVDWTETRDALRAAAGGLRSPDISGVGRWALVYVLRATGDSDDAKEAERIAEDLSGDRGPMKMWRLIEEYCATDPCDPASNAPENIDVTASAYNDINLAELCRGESQTRDHQFFTSAQTGLARFRPDAAIGVLRAWADQALTREQDDFRLAAFELADHTVALDDRIAKPYVEKARAIALAALDKGEDRHNEAWVAAQFALAVAFPHMSGNEQFDALINHPEDKTVLQDLGFLLQPIDETRLEHALDKAIRDNDFVAQFRTLCFAEYSHTCLTDRTKDLVLGLIDSTHDHVRLSALSLIRATSQPKLLAGLAASSWSAASLDPISRKIEILHGSEALVQAAALGFIPPEACLDRIAPCAYRNFVERLGPAAVSLIAVRLNAAIRHAAEFKIERNLPDIEQCFEGRHWPSQLHISARQTDDEGIFALAKTRAERNDAWHRRQRENEEVAEEFERDLIRAGARIVIDAVSVEMIKAIDKAIPDTVDSWREFMLDLDDRALANLHNVALVVAQAISERDAAAGLRLFERLRRSSACIRVTFGRDRIGLDAVAVWGAFDNKEMRAFQFTRLDHIRNDHDLAMEVLAAIRMDRLPVVRDYVIDRRRRPESAHRARAVMIAGLSPAEPWATETIDMFQDECGFLGKVYTSARYAMERHQWSRHWASQMHATTNPTELWRNTVVLSRIVDGRFGWSEVDGNPPNPLIERFGSTLYGPIRDRIRKWKNKRHSKLFGMDLPNKDFLING
ncbi:hypothetical protein X882_562 [Burkholderia pseudomallei MSHR4303]|nr:hypothetical protein X882_562 [Burkholderia pseudomallei MSHR4303]